MIKIKQLKKYPCDLCRGNELVWIKVTERIDHLLDHINDITKEISYINYNEAQIINKLLGETK